MPSSETPIVNKSVNLFKDVLLPIVKAETATNSWPALANLLSAAVIEWPTGIFHHLSYIINPCNRGIVYSEHDAGYEFYEWMFPEQN